MTRTTLSRLALLAVVPGILACTPDSNPIVGETDTDSTGTDGTGGAGSTGGTSAGTGAGPATSGGGSTGGSGGGTTAAGTTDGPEAFFEACVSSANALRAMESLPALTRWTEKEACAMDAAQADAASGEVHGSSIDCEPIHPTWCQRGMDEVPEDAIADCAQAYFDEGPGGGTYQQLMDPAITRVACGWAETPAGVFWAYHLFG